MGYCATVEIGKRFTFFRQRMDGGIHVITRYARFKYVKNQEPNFRLGGYMKKLTKRIACGALSVMMLSTLAVEGFVRRDADASVNSAVNSTALADSVSFKNVTG